MIGNQHNQHVFAISTDFAQSFAERSIGRKLTARELTDFQKNLAKGLMHDIETFFEVLLEQVLDKETN